MVYDERSNFVGDTHWRQDHEFDEGEELELERGGIMVDVGECIGKRDQDLTELVDKRVKEREQRAAAKHAASPMRPQNFQRAQTPPGSARLRPKSLNAVLGNPTGQYSKVALQNISSFEQRQQARRDENELKMPTKRRKQDHTPPSKNGYAQSLMGTKLTLATSRPPSTASIRYEPFRSSIQRTPAATIDLTEDNSDRNRPDTMLHDTDRRGGSAKKPSRQQVHECSAISGYASNLTGAPLTLKRPESFSSERSFTGVDLNTERTKQAQETKSCSVGPDSFMEDVVPIERPTKRIEGYREPEKKRTTSPFTVLSSPPPVRSQPTSESTSIAKDKTIEDSTFGQFKDQPLSTLRIKSRPPRKMMMLMNRPTLRPPAATESSGHILTGPRKQQPSTPAAYQVVDSQATVRLDAFCEKQERRLQDRLNGVRSGAHSDQPSPFPADSGIDHQIIESRKKTEAKGIPAEIYAAAQHVTSSVNLNEPYMDEKATRIWDPDLSMIAVDTGSVVALEYPTFSNEPSFGSNHTPAEMRGPWPLRQTPEFPKTLPPSITPITDVRSSQAVPPSQTRKPHESRTSAVLLPQTTAGHTGANYAMVSSPSKALIAKNLNAAKLSPDVPSLNVVHRYHHPPAPPSEGDQDLEVNEGQKIVSVQRPVYPQSANTRTKGNLPYPVDTKTMQPHSTISNAAAVMADRSETPSEPLNGDVAGVTEIPLPVPVIESSRNPAATSKVPSLPAHFGAGITSATSNSCLMLKFSGSPPGRSDQQCVHLEPPSAAAAPALEAAKQSSVPSKVSIKASPKPSLPFAKEPAQETEGEDATEPATGFEKKSDLRIPIIPDAELGQPISKLVNPATRGPSVQVTAKRTLNALVSASNGLSSMTATSMRPGITVHKECSNSKPKELVKEVTPGGPWSRESFDLFGTWRPPRRTGTKGC
jgi:hypothetical protein